MSLRFDSSTDRLYRTANVPSFTGATVCGWAKRVSYASRSNCIIGFGDEASGSPGRSKEIYWDPSGNLSWTWYDSVSGYDYGSFSTQPGTDWFFCAITSSGTEGRDSLFYVGRYGDLSLEVATKYETVSRLTSLAIVFAGDNGWGESGDFILDGWRFYDRALTGAELELERWKRSPSGVAAPNVWLPMLDNTSTTTQAQDYSGNGRDASTTSLAVQTDSAPVGWGCHPVWINTPVIAAQNAATAGIDAAVRAVKSATAALSAYVESGAVLTQSEVDMLTDIWRRFGLDVDNPLVQSEAAISFGPVIALSGTSEITSTRSGATILPPATASTMLSEVWKRLGLDTDNPMTASATQITAGAIVQTISESTGTVTVQRA